MKNTFAPQIPQNVFVFRLNQTKRKETSREVWQDKIAKRRDRGATDEPAAGSLGGRSVKKSTEPHRLQMTFKPSDKTTPLTLHVPVFLKERLQRIVEREKLISADGAEEPLSLSKAGGTFLARGMQQDIDMQYGAFLTPIIEKAVEKDLQNFRNELRWLLVRVAFDANQTRTLVTNILSRQSGVTQKMREKILVESARAAKKNIFGKTPQLHELVQMFDARAGAENENAQ